MSMEGDGLDADFARVMAEAGEPIEQELDEAATQAQIRADIDAAVVGLTGMTLEERRQFYESAYRGDPDRVAQALNEEVGHIVRAAWGITDEPEAQSRPPDGAHRMTGDQLRARDDAADQHQEDYREGNG